MSPLAILRSAGVTVRIADNGGIGVKGATADQKAFVVANKTPIVAALKREAQGGAIYEESFLRFWIEDYYLTAKRIKRAGIDSESCDRLMRILMDIHTAGQESLADARAKVATHKDEALDLTRQMVQLCSPVLEGDSLASTVTQVFGVVPLSVAIAPVAAPAGPRIDLGAFTGGVTTEQGALAI